MSSAAPTISFSGLASGLDTTSIISELTATAQLPITSLNKQITGYNSQVADWQSLNSNLAALQSAVKTLSNQSTLSIPAAASSNPLAASITAQVGVPLGSHSLSVSQLATAQEIVSTSVSSGTTALGLTGSFMLNGKTIQVNTSDALSDVASKINAASAGVNANVVAVGTNDYRLTVTSAQTGAANSIAASDSGGTVLSGLGLLQAGPPAARQTISYMQGATAYIGAASLTLGDTTKSVGSLLGIAAGAAQSGTFHITNGGTGAGNEADVAINLNTDSLTSIANAINKAGIKGISAEVVTVPDVNGNLNRVHQLRIVGAGTSPATPSTATATGPSLGATSTFGGSVTVNGQTATLTGNANTISQLQAAIQATTGNAGITAAIVSGALVLSDPTGAPITATTTTLQSFLGGVNKGALANPAIANGAPGTATTPAFTADPNGILSTIGVTQKPYTRIVTQAQDAKFNLDGLDLTRGTNIINDAVPSASLTLLSGTAATPATTTLNITQNTASTVQAISKFAAAYNAVQDFITSENKFTPPTNTTLGAAGISPLLFGNPALTQIQQTLASALSAVSGKNTLASIGISLNGANDLAVDANALTTALQTDPNIVSNLFGLSGASDSSSIQFIKGSAKSGATTGTGYTVAITQAATQTTGTAGTASTGVSLQPETLTFAGSLFPGSVNLTIPQGSTVQQTAALLNSTSSLNTGIYASVDAANRLVIASQNYGAGNSFTVGSDTVASASNSGIGPSLSVTGGMDVAGTINGEAANGIGRTLTGNSGDKHIDGVQLLVTATAASATAGHITVTHGIADSLAVALSQVLDPSTGAVAGAENGLNSQVAAAQAQITKIQTTVDDYKKYLTLLFSQMETRVSRLQAQGSAFTAAFGSTSNNNSSNSGSGSKSSSL